MNEKMKLYLNVKSDGLYCVSREWYKIIDEKTGDIKDRYNTISEQKIASYDNDSVSDFVGSYIEAIAPKMVYIALRTVFAKSPNRKIWDLMCECVRYNGSDSQTVEAFEQSIANSHEIISRMTRTEKKDFKRFCFEVECAENMVSNYTKEHTFTMVKSSDGKRHKMEVIPYITFERSRYGKVLFDEISIAEDTDVMDLIQTASLAMLEIYDMGLINAFHDFWYYNNYVFNKVNRAIMGERRNVVYNVQYTMFTDWATNEDKYIANSRLDKKLAKVERTAFVETVCTMLKALLNPRVNKENAIFCFTHFYIYGQSKSDIAKHLKIDEKMVRRLLNYCDNALRTPDFYETLNFMLYEYIG